MRDGKVIDAEFTVVELGGDMATPAPPELKAGVWSFWGDDVPNLLGIAGGFGTAILVWCFFHR
jgi:hypothetical protein